MCRSFVVIKVCRMYIDCGCVEYGGGSVQWNARF